MNERYKVLEGPESVQGTQEWLEFRIGKISASMAPIIMGVSPYKTKLDLWNQITSGKESKKTWAMEMGNRMEPKALEWMNSQKGLTGTYKPAVVQSLTHPDFMASLDGFYMNEGRPHLLEIKCAGLEDHLTAIEGKIPEKYYPQLQHQMDLIGANSMLYLSFHDEEGVVVPCFRNEEYCKRLFAEELSFLSSLTSLTAPKITDRDWVQIEDDLCETQANLYLQICEKIDLLEREKEKCKEALLKNVTHPLTRIGNLRVQKVMKPGNIDYKKMIEDYKITDSEKYRKESIQTWRFTNGL